MRKMVCWPHLSELHHKDRLTENQSYQSNLKGDWEGRAHFSSSQRGSAQARGNHCKLNFWPSWRKAKAVSGRGLTMEEVTDPGSKRSPPGTHRKKFVPREQCPAPCPTSYYLETSTSSLPLSVGKARAFNPWSELLDVGQPDNTGKEEI